MQKEVVVRCRQQGKPVIVASHLLQSMLEFPTPTRAEVCELGRGGSSLRVLPAACRVCFEGLKVSCVPCTKLNLGHRGLPPAAVHAGVPGPHPLRGV